MLLLDLQWLLFSFLLILVIAVTVAVWLDRWLQRRETTGALPGVGELPSALERAPFGVLVLEGLRICRYVNPYARHLLKLAPPPCRLPEEPWFQILNEDRIAARLEAATETRYRTVPLSSDQVVRWWVTPWGDLDLVFLNLLDNAVTYSRPGDRVMVSLQHIQKGVECTVCDTGPGIPAQHLPHVTRRFYRAAPQAAAGSGLGLAIVEEILRHHESRLEIESQAEGEETGTRVRFVLPVVTDKGEG